MRQAIKYAATVVSVQGANPGPASGITYTVAVSMGSNAPLIIPRVVPHNTRLPDAINTRAAQPGTAIDCYGVDGALQFIISESFDYVEACQ